MNVLHIAVRELKATFATAIGWLVLCGWLLITGLLWVAMIGNYVLQSQDLVFNPYGGQSLQLTDHLLLPFFGNCAVVLLMIAPALSMRLFSEEVKQRTLELLLTSPLTTFEIVLGKFFGATAFLLVMLAATLQFPIGLQFWGQPDPGVLLGCYLGLLLMSSSLVSLGMFASALTQNQVVALMMAFAGALGLLLVEWLSQDPNDVFAQIAIMSHLNDLMRGAIRVSDVAYFMAFISFFLFATHQRVESFRWR